MLDFNIKKGMFRIGDDGHIDVSEEIHAEIARANIMADTDTEDGVKDVE